MMPFRLPGRQRISGFLLQARPLLAICGMAFLPCHAAQPSPKPVSQIALSDLGFPGYPLSLLHAGASMTTIHLLDNTHLLFTFSMRTLVSRVPGEDKGDTARMVQAEVVELPTGKVLAQTIWRMHDHSRYLWNMGHGVFVLRTGGALSVLAPLEALKRGDDPLRRYGLAHRPGMPVLVEGSPDGKLITIELETEHSASAEVNNEREQRKHYVLEFYRLSTAAKSAPVEIEAVGAIGSPMLLRLAMDGDGYLWAEDHQRGSWTVSFNEFGGKQETLTPVLSSCHPRMNLLSRNEFLVESCRGSDLSPMFSSFGFDGHENWQEQFGEALQPPTLALAPASGRFAMSRLVASSGVTGTGIVGDDPIQQELRVYGIESGDLLLHVQCAPAMRTAENFDLSPDGRTLVVLGTKSVDLYQLPELSKRERQDLADAATMSPPEGSGPVNLSRITRPVQAPETIAGGDAVRPHDDLRNPAAAASARTSQARAQATPRTASDGVGETPAASPDGAVTAVRKPPTLLQPGETPEYKGQVDQGH